MIQGRFFNLSDHYQKLSELGHPLEALATVVNGEHFRPPLLNK